MLVFSLAWAENAVCETACDPCVVPLQHGEPAPFSGQLLAHELAADLGVRAESCDRWVALEVARTSSLARVERDAELEIMQIDLTRLERESAALERDRDFWRAQAVAEPIFVLTPTFLVPVSIALGLGLGLLIHR